MEQMWNIYICGLSAIGWLNRPLPNNSLFYKYDIRDVGKSGNSRWFQFVGTETQLNTFCDEIQKQYKIPNSDLEVL